MASKPWKHKIAIHTLSNISRSKDNQTIKFRQLIEYIIRKIFLQKSYSKSGEETITTPYTKKSNLSMSLDQ